ncbi:hypothetical protein GH733_004021 [Mirounga leonina]|nr:hypothetical protein GH733_004021 [Mirounga leonina]
MKDGQKITFHGEGDQEPGLEPGDIIIVLDQKDHAVFTRRGEDLFMYMDIQLVEAMCGFQKPISTLDNRTIVITSHPGQIVKHGDIKCVLNEGMPIYRRPYEKGRLIIEFKVNFPENGFLSPDKLSLLEKLLPERKEVEETDEMDQVELVDFDPNQERRRHYNGEAYEDDEHHPREEDSGVRQDGSSPGVLEPEGWQAPTWRWQSDLILAEEWLVQQHTAHNMFNPWPLWFCHMPYLPT